MLTQTSPQPICFSAPQKKLDRNETKMGHEMPCDHAQRPSPGEGFSLQQVQRGKTQISPSPKRPVNAEQGTISVARGHTLSNNKKTITIHHSFISPLNISPVNISAREQEHAAFSLKWFIEVKSRQDNSVPRILYVSKD